MNYRDVYDRMIKTHFIVLIPATILLLVFISIDLLRREYAELISPIVGGLFGVISVNIGQSIERKNNTSLKEAEINELKLQIIDRATLELVNVSYWVIRAMLKHSNFLLKQKQHPVSAAILKDLSFHTPFIDSLMVKTIPIDLEQINALSGFYTGFTKLNTSVKMMESEHLNERAITDLAWQNLRNDILDLAKILGESLRLLGCEYILDEEKIRLTESELPRYTRRLSPYSGKRLYTCLIGLSPKKGPTIAGEVYWEKEEAQISMEENENATG